MTVRPGSYFKESYMNPNRIQEFKLGRPKSYNDKKVAMDGVYGNSNLMHATASLVGCVVQVLVRDGTTYEGILNTFSHQYDVVLEMTHKVSPKGPPPTGVGPSVSNLIASYPFEEGISDKLIFKLTDIVMINAHNVDTDYAIKDTFTDTAISKFNGQVLEKELEPWDGASSDSESAALGTEEDDGANGWDANDMFRTNAEKYGVVSSYDNSLQEYTVPLTKKDTEEYKLKEAKANRIAREIENNTSYQNRIQLENGDEEDRFSAVVRTEEAPSKYVMPHKRRNGLRRQNSTTASPVHAGGTRAFQLSSNHSPPSLHKTSINGVEEPAVVLSGPPKAYVVGPPASHTRIEKRLESERKLPKHKGRNDEIEEFRKFSSNFKLAEENKETSEMSEDFSSSETKADLTLLSNKLVEQVKIEKDAEDKPTDVLKSTLNPNAKEFVLNPNAKTFTPRSMSVSSQQTLVPVQTQRLQAQSPVIVVPHSQMIPGLPQPLFSAVGPQYVMQATPVSLTTSFGAASQAPRFRKVPISMQPRHEVAPSMHVAAATGQPILAPGGMPTPSQLTMQYTGPQGVIHTSGPPQQPMGYPQMNFVVGPRVVSPQPTSHSVSYCDTSHLPTHLMMPPYPGASMSGSSAGHSMQGMGPQQHSSHIPNQQHPPPSPAPPNQPPSMYPPGHLGPQLHQGFPPQPVVLMPQQHQGSPHPLHLHQMHGQGHQMALLSTPPYLQQTQGV